MKYLHYFETETAFTESYENRYDEPWVSYTEETYSIAYNKSEYERLLGTELTFNIISDGAVNYDLRKDRFITPTELTGEYRLNWGEWVGVTGQTSINVSAGDVIQFRTDNDSLGSTDAPSYYGTFMGSTCVFTVSGNVMSMIRSTNFSSLKDFPENTTRNLAGLFLYCTGLTDAEHLLLPATAVTEVCYACMFYHCDGLTKAPELPATVLGSECYSAMFGYCTNLTTAPELPATSLSTGCYGPSYSEYGTIGMFGYCSSLVNAPALPATALTSICYGAMFIGCSSLVNAPVLPATQLASECYKGMFAYCTSITTAPALPATSLAMSCYRGMFQGCVSLVTPPALPATALTNYCYGGVDLSDSTFTGMFAYCSSLETAPELPAPTLVNECYAKMFYNCENLSYIKCMATSNASSARYTRSQWVYGVAASGTFEKDASMSFQTGDNGIPNGWTVVNV